MTRTQRNKKGPVVMTGPIHFWLLPALIRGCP